MVSGINALRPLLAVLPQLIELIKLVPRLKQALARLFAISDRLENVDQHLKEVRELIASSEDGVNRNRKEVHERLASSEDRVSRNLKEIHERLASTEESVNRNLKEVHERLASTEEGVNRNLKDIREHLLRLDHTAAAQANLIADKTRPQATLPWQLGLGLAVVATGAVALAIIVTVIR